MSRLPIKLTVSPDVLGVALNVEIVCSCPMNIEAGFVQAFLRSFDGLPPERGSVTIAWEKGKTPSEV
jgi:hypothetical protein